MTAPATQLMLHGSAAHGACIVANGPCGGNLGQGGQGAVAHPGACAGEELAYVGALVDLDPGDEVDELRGGVKDSHVLVEGEVHVKEVSVVGWCTRKRDLGGVGIPHGVIAGEADPASGEDFGQARNRRRPPLSGHVNNDGEGVIFMRDRARSLQRVPIARWVGVVQGRGARQLHGADLPRCRGGECRAAVHCGTQHMGVAWGSGSRLEHGDTLAAGEAHTLL